jgi:hypothetical protein
MTARKGDREGLVGMVRRVLGDANKTIVAAGSLVAALAALITAVALLLPGNAPTPEASFAEANVEPNVLLEQYVASGEATASTGDGSQARLAGYRLAADTAPAFARPAIGVLAIVSAGSTATSASSSTTSSAAQDEAASKEEGTLKTELKLQETEALQEEAKQKEQAKLDEEKALTEQGRQEEEKGGGEQSGLRRAEKATAEAAMAEAKAVKAREEARLRATEAATVEKEKEHPGFTAPPPSLMPFHIDGEAKVLTGTGVSTREVERVIHMAGIKAPSDCDASCPLRPTVESAIADTSSNLEEAAKEVAAVFHSSRVQVFEHKSQPVGVTVDYVVDFVGYAGKRTILEWTLCSKLTERPLPREWWRNVIVKQIEPTSEKAKITGSFWAPIPPRRGDYYFRLRVFHGGSEVAHRKTEQFN